MAIKNTIDLSDLVDDYSIQDAKRVVEIIEKRIEDAIFQVGNHVDNGVIKLMVTKKNAETFCGVIVAVMSANIWRTHGYNEPQRTKNWVGDTRENLYMKLFDLSESQPVEERILHNGSTDWEVERKLEEKINEVEALNKQIEMLTKLVEDKSKRNGTV